MNEKSDIAQEYQIIFTFSYQHPTKIVTLQPFTNLTLNLK